MSFDSEFAEHHSFVLRLARELAGDRQGAEDVAQEVWLARFAKPPRETGTPRRWLARVVRNKASNRLQQERRVSRTEVEAARPEAVELERLDARAEVQTRIAQAVRGLDERYRHVVYLRYYEGLSPGEMASRLGVPLATVKTRLNRALQRLRTAVERDYPGGRAAWQRALLPWVNRARPLRRAPQLWTLAFAVSSCLIVAALWGASSSIQPRSFETAVRADENALAHVSLHGRVVDADGRPLVEAQVFLSSYDRRNLLLLEGHLYDSAEADSNGHFRLACPLASAEVPECGRRMALRGTADRRPCERSNAADAGGIHRLSRRPAGAGALPRQRAHLLRAALRRAGSPRIAVVLDRIGESTFDLYLDLNSDRAVDVGERIAESGSTWRVRVPAALADGAGFERDERWAVFQAAAGGGLLKFGALGHFEGELEWLGQRVRARRVDGDGNGFFTDPLDRVWIDRDGSGQFDPWDEQFLFAPVVRVGDARVVLRSDAYGRKLELTTLTGTGTVELAVRAPYAGGQPAAEPAQPLALRVTWVERDGSVLTLADRATEVPAGEYRVAAVEVRLADADGGSPWNFVFTASGRVESEHWTRVDAGSTKTFDPIGTLEWSAGVEPSEGALASGATLSGRPRLSTADGLTLNRAWRGAAAGGAYGGVGGVSSEALIRLSNIEGIPVAQDSSGFV